MWFGVRFPALALELFERRQSAGGAMPTVLMEGGRVSMLNAAARAAGVTPGASLATALGIVGHLRHSERDAALERKRLRQLAEVAYRHTPCASVSDPDSLVLDVGASLKLFGGVAALASELDALFRRLRHTSRIAFAATPAAALALAHADEALDWAGVTADGQGVARALAWSRAALRRVALDCAALDGRDIERLADMGILSIGQLLDLPRDELGARFGPAMQDYLARLVGAAPDPRVPVTPRERFDAAIHLVESVPNRAALRFPMHRLAADLAAWLKARQLGALRLAWRFEPLRGRGAGVEARFADARGDAKGLLDVSWLKLEGTPLPDAVTSVRLRALEVAPRTAASASLFGPVAAAAARPLALVDALAARLGDGSVHGLAAVDDHRPEFAWAPRSPGGAWRQRDGSVPTAPRRPLWLFETPRPVAVGCLELLAGPERIEAGWWDNPVARDYYVAAGADGAQCWVFRELEAAGATHDADGRDPAPAGADAAAQRWFLHGYFA